MSNILSMIYGPLDKVSCVYFLVLTVFFFLALVAGLIGYIIVIFKDRKQIKFSNIIGGLYMLFSIFIAYFVNRLLYTMCNKSLA
jgi:hypothetical protein